MGLGVCDNCGAGPEEIIFKIQRQSAPGATYKLCAECLLGIEDIAQFECTESIKLKKEEEEW